MNYEFSKEEIKDYDRLLYIKADTKRLMAVEFINGKRKLLLNKEREVRKTNAGGMAKKKYRRFYGQLKKYTSSWHLEQLEKIQREKYDLLKLDIDNEKYKTTILNFLKKKITNKKWFERFRYFKKDNCLIIGGKDRSSNDDLLKNYLENDDLVFHTESRGSPFFIIKGKADKDLIEFTATATAKYSKEWKNNKKDVEVMYIKGSQIYKDKSMNVGTFGVRNDKNTIIIKKEDIERFKN